MWELIDLPMLRLNSKNRQVKINLRFGVTNRRNIIAAVELSNGENITQLVNDLIGLIDLTDRGFTAIKKGRRFG
ncbi:unnamed protein product [marine sediment metagenome]|uniref:Uncharacterized protein n=1 Tax=marine sediment metagenome TaxID=412755 RepID=X1KH42_9ZZZZ